MFSKYATVLAFAASAIAGVITPGRYRISNVASQSPAISFKTLTTVFVSEPRDRRSPFELWDISSDSEDGTYTFKNVGLGTYAAASDGSIITDETATTFNIESAGNDQYVIKLADSLWNVEPDKDINLKLRPANGRASATERWKFYRLFT